MPDLKLDVESAVATIGKQLDRGIESLRGTAEGLIRDIKSVAEVLDGPMRLNIADADAACVIDFQTDNYPARRHVRLDLDGGCGGYVELANPLPPGRYRAVVLLNKIG